MTDKQVSLAKIVHRCEEGEQLDFKVHDSVAEFEGRPDIRLYVPKVDYDKIFTYYISTIAYTLTPKKAEKALASLTKTSFKEKIANLRNPEVLSDFNGQTLNLDWVTSADVVAARNDLASGLYQLAAIGVVETGDDKIVIGIRGGEDTPDRRETIGVTMYGFPPGGSVTFKPEYGVGPVEDTLKAEFAEEVGDFEIIDERFIGIFEALKTDEVMRGPTGYKFVSVLKTPASFEEIQVKHSKALGADGALKAEGYSKDDRKKALHDLGLPPDAWEHSSLEAFPRDPGEIYHRLTEKDRFAAIGEGALQLYVEDLERRG